MAGCATIQAPLRTDLDAADAPVRDCASWFKTLDSTIDAARVGDIGARRIAGFPYLRIDRFTAALARPVLSDSRAFNDMSSNDDLSNVGLSNAELFNDLIKRMQALDADGRRVEIANLPAQAIDRLGVANRAAAVARIQDCAERLAAADLADEATRKLLAQRAQVADDYSTLKRALGLYPIVQVPFSNGIKNWQREATEMIQAARSGELPQQPVIRYVPPDSAGYSRPEVAALLERASRRPFGVADFSAEERERLFATYAPLLEIETKGDYDRIGALFWGASPAPEVDLARPTVYRKLAYTRYGGRTLLQLVYVAWMPARPKDSAFDLLGGRLDGLIWRVTLAEDGEPVLFDTIHPCGCFHMFFTTPRVEPLPAPESLIEWAFSPATLPDVRDGERVVLSVQTRTHYLRNVSLTEHADGTGYTFADYDSLRTLALPGGGTRSAFCPDGLVPGTQRGERFFFWPMGIESAGAMRQWGTHATAFVGRRHFDDADLIQRRFKLLP